MKNQATIKDDLYRAYGALTDMEYTVMGLKKDKVDGLLSDSDTDKLSDIELHLSSAMLSIETLTELIEEKL